MLVSTKWARILVIASGMVLALSLAISAYSYFSLPLHHFSLRDFDISDLQWYKGNPNGYLFATIGPMVAMLLVLPLTRYFKRRFETPARRTALVGSALLELTVMVFVANAVLSALASDDWFVHGVLARTSFALFILSNVVLLHAAMAHEKQETGGKGRTTSTLLLLTHASLFIILVVFIGPFVIGINYPKQWVGLEPTAILGSCEVLYLVLGYTTLYQLTKIAQPSSLR